MSCQGNPVRQEDVYLRRRTSRIKLSKYAAYNTYHHCEQCHQYLGFNPRYQVSSNNTKNTQSDEWHSHTDLNCKNVTGDAVVLSYLIFRCMSQRCMPSHLPICCLGKRYSSILSSQSLKSTTSASANQEASWREYAAAPHLWLGKTFPLLSSHSGIKALKTTGKRYRNDYKWLQLKKGFASWWCVSPIKTYYNCMRTLISFKL